MPAGAKPRVPEGFSVELVASGLAQPRVIRVAPNGDLSRKGGGPFAHECLIFEVCQPQQAKKVLDQNMSVSTALPCRISLYEEGGKTILATLKPTTLLAMFNTPQLKGGGAGSGSHDC